MTLRGWGTHDLFTDHPRDPQPFPDGFIKTDVADLRPSGSNGHGCAVCRAHYVIVVVKDLRREADRVAAPLRVHLELRATEPDDAVRTEHAVPINPVSVGRRQLLIDMDCLLWVIPQRDAPLCRVRRMPMRVRGMRTEQHRSPSNSEGEDDDNPQLLPCLHLATVLATRGDRMTRPSRGWCGARIAIRT